MCVCVCVHIPVVMTHQPRYRAPPRQNVFLPLLPLLGGNSVGSSLYLVVIFMSVAAGGRWRCSNTPGRHFKASVGNFEAAASLGYSV